MKNASKRNLSVIFVILISTLTIIWTNYIFSKQIALDINNQIMQNEYKKIWGQDNYTLLKEIQKKEILSYIDKLKKEKPELIYKIRVEANKNPNKHYLSWKNLNNIKSNYTLKWNSGATTTIVEFSDMECPYCIKLHNKQTIQNILKNSSWSINYVFKNFPLPTHKNSEREAIASKCIEKISNSKKSLEFIDNVFKTTSGWGEWYDLSKIDKEITNLWLNNKDFNTCYINEKSRKMVIDEFNLWTSLWINSTPTSLVINNKTGEYIMLKWDLPESNFNDAISKIK